MKIVITCIASGNVGLILNENLVFIENSLNLFFINRQYGEIQQFTTVAIATDSEIENERFGKGHNKVGRFKHPITCEKITYLSFALFFDPTVIESTNNVEIRSMVCDSLIKRLHQPNLKIPKTFRYDEFVAHLEERLNILKRVTLT